MSEIAGPSVRSRQRMTLTNQHVDDLTFPSALNGLHGNCIEAMKAKALGSCPASCSG